jgi:hypothetical protein
MWRMRARSGVEHAKALRNATEDFFILTPAERSKIRNRAAWIADRYERGFEKIGKCRAVTRQAQTQSEGSVKKPQGLSDYKTDDEVLAFVRENGFPNATILPEDQP